MKDVPKDARKRNVTGPAECQFCADTGYATVQTRTVMSAWALARKPPNADGSMPHEGVFEEVAPCPFCEAGFREEFPVPRADNKRATSPPWRDGYWQGREPVEIEAVGSGSPLSQAENARRMRELAERMAQVTRPMPE